MAVYVDPIYNWGWHLGPSCHLTADTNEELHAFAARLGLKRSWFQKGSHPHYDLVASKRKAAVNAGAIEETPADRDRRLKAWREAAVAAIKAAATEEEKRRVREYLFR